MKKNYLLDVSDCSECVMLPRPKVLMRWDRRNFSDTYGARLGGLRNRTFPKIDRLTESYFTGKPETAPQQTTLEYLIQDLSPEVSASETVTPSFGLLETTLGVC